MAKIRKRDIGCGSAAITAIIVMREIPNVHPWEIILVAGVLGLALLMLFGDWAFASSLAAGKIARPFLLVTLVAAVSAGWAWYCWPPVIGFSPPEATFGNFAFAREAHTFTAENKSGKDLYYVQLALKTIGQSPEADNYEFDIPSGNRKPIISGSNFADTIGLACRTETPGVGMLIFQIFHMRPSERREFIITHTTNMQGLIKSSITHFSYDEPPMINDPQGMEQDLISPGEKVTCYREVAWPADGTQLQKNWNVTINPEQKGNPSINKGAS